MRRGTSQSLSTKYFLTHYLCAVAKLAGQNFPQRLVFQLVLLEELEVLELEDWLNPRVDDTLVIVLRYHAKEFVWGTYCYGKWILALLLQSNGSSLVSSQIHQCKQVSNHANSSSAMTFSCYMIYPSVCVPQWDVSICWIEHLCLIYLHKSHELYFPIF